MSAKYRNNFLKNVTVRIDFNKNLYPISSELPPSLKEKVLERFSHMQRKAAIAEQIEMKCGSTEPTRRHVKENHWFFQGKEGDRALCIAPNFMWLDFRKYTDYEDLRETFFTMTDAFFDAFPEVPDLNANRFGIRYFNNIELTDPALTDWTEYLAPNLLSIFSVADDRSAISRAFHNLELNYGDMNLTFLYGMYNFEYPAPIRQKTFTLDFDSYIAKVLKKDELSSSLDSMHDRIVRYFENSITDKFRDMMNR
jgi:uncharacterized protein (TIGR04255 family)